MGLKNLFPSRLIGTHRIVLKLGRKTAVAVVALALDSQTFIP